MHRNLFSVLLLYMMCVFVFFFFFNKCLSHISLLHGVMYILFVIRLDMVHIRAEDMVGENNSSV